MVTGIHTTGVHAAVRAAKYSQGFMFGSDASSEDSARADYARAVVERSCAAVVTLLQDMFAAAERKAFEQASEPSAISRQNHTFQQLADIIQCRSIIENSVVTAVACAYAEMANAGLASQSPVREHNNTEIALRISALENLCCERLDLVQLFAIDKVKDHVTNRNRPLLFDLNAKLGLLFGCDSKQVVCSPLSPATLIGGFVVGLMCADMDIRSKKLLFCTFEQELLSKLSVLMNSMILRLEQENLLAKRPLGFDEKNAGPIARILSSHPVVALRAVQQAVDVMHKALASHRSAAVARDLYELSSEDSTDSLINLLSDVSYYSRDLQTSVLRMAINKTETDALAETWRVIIGQVNTAFAGKKMPTVVKKFLHTLWPGVLFDIYIVAGDSSEIWQEAVAFQHGLLESVTPVQDTEKTTILNQTIAGVLKTLRRLFEESAYRYEDTAAFVSELKSLHLQNMQQKLNTDSFVLWENISVNGFVAAAEPFLTEDEWVCYGQMRKVMSLLAYA